VHSSPRRSISWCQLLLFVPVAAWLVAGCASVSRHPATSTWLQLRDDMNLVLHQAISIPPGRSTVVIQQGEVIYGGRNRYLPFCELSVRELADQPQLIQPDVFRITAVRGQTLYVQRPAMPLPQLAALDSFVLATSAGSDDSLPIDITETWRMRLASTTQPWVILLVCGGEEDNLVSQAEPPTLEQIGLALGSVASLQRAKMISRP